MKRKTIDSDDRDEEGEEVEDDNYMDSKEEGVGGEGTNLAVMDSYPTKSAHQA